MFKKNVGAVCSAIRLTVGIVALAGGFLAFGALQGSVFPLFAVAIGAIGVVTGATRRCPTYVLLGISTDGSETSAVAQHPSRAHA